MTSRHAAPQTSATHSHGSPTTSASASPHKHDDGANSHATVAAMARSIHADRLASAVHTQLLECMKRAVEEDENLATVERQLEDELARVRARLDSLTQAATSVFGTNANTHKRSLDVTNEN
jgi:ABC-type Zn2+ transport system substrate-binding protein/surface adhesin